MHSSCDFRKKVSHFYIFRSIERYTVTAAINNRILISFRCSFSFEDFPSLFDSIRMTSRNLGERSSRLILRRTRDVMAMELSLPVQLFSILQVALFATFLKFGSRRPPPNACSTLNLYFYSSMQWSNANYCATMESFFAQREYRTTEPISKPTTTKLCLLRN